MKKEFLLFAFAFLIGGFFYATGAQAATLYQITDASNQNCALNGGGMTGIYGSSCNEYLNIYFATSTNFNATSSSIGQVRILIGVTDHNYKAYWRCYDMLPSRHS